jgi:hypothetical protein
MRRRPPPEAVKLTAWRGKPEHEQNRLVLEWLGHDARRAELYAAIRLEPAGVLDVPSRARHDDDDILPAGGAELSHRVMLVADPALVQQGLTDGVCFSNLPYRRLGSGEFLLGLDPAQNDGPLHAAQARLLKHAFTPPMLTVQNIQDIAAWSGRAATTTLLGRDTFDAALYAEHAALRFVQVLFGFATADLNLLADTLRTAYRAMTVQMLGRHFVTEPAAVPAGRAALARLAARCALLMQEYGLGRDHLGEGARWPDGLEEPGGGLPSFHRVLKTLALQAEPLLDGQARAVLAVGTLAGTVHNIQAASCIALKHLLADPALLAAARAAALKAGPDGDPVAALWQDHIAPALRANPPAPFLPRRMRHPKPGLPTDADVVLCVGSATLTTLPPSQADAIVFGLDTGDAAAGLHYCLGTQLAKAMASRIVGDLLRLPGLEEGLDATDGLPIGLEKRWGFACETYPLRYRRDRRVWQQPLNVLMRVRQPVDLHGEALRAVIRNGAPRIERLLRESRHVHFAWFEFLEDGHVLALHTVFDGDFEAYLQHFALQAGELFDRLFEHLEDPPPKPVRDNPEAFVRNIMAHHRGPAEGYFFSAYPDGHTPKVLRALQRLR